MFARRLKSVVLAAALATPAAGFAGTNLEPTLQLTLEERYDDDVLLRTDEVQPLRGELMTRISPRGGLKLTQRTLTADGWYAPDLRLRHFSGQVHVDHRGGLDLDKRLSARTGISAELRAWRVSDPTALPRMGMARTLSPVLYGTGQLSLDTRLQERLTGYLRYRFEGTQIQEVGNPTGHVHQPSAELWYQVTRRASVGAEYRYQHFFYGADTSRAHAPAAAFRYLVTRNTSFTARGGPVWFESLSGGPSGLTPRVHLQLARDARGLELGVQVGQDVVGASGFTDAVWAQYGGIYGTLIVSEPFRIFAAVYGFRNGEAPGTPERFLGADAESTAGYAVGGGVEWRFNRHLMLQGQLDRVAQVGVYGPDGDLSRNVAAVRLVVTPW